MEDRRARRGHRAAVTPPAVDHLVVATPDLDAGVAAVEALLGVDAVPGGAHPGLGTRNALVGLGRRSYLEVVGPDPEQPPPGRPRWFGIDGLDAPRLVTWAAPAADLGAVARRAREAGLDLGQPREGERLRPGGAPLRWAFTDPFAPRMDGVLPFFIRWGEGAHPGDALSARCALVELRLRHPRVDAVAPAVRALGLNVAVEAGPPGVEAVLDTPRGRVALLGPLAP